MISHVVFKKDYRCFKEGERIDFRPGVNLLVGDQGSGKSTLLEAMIGCSASRNDRPARERLSIVPVDGVERLSLKYFDFEQMNPRVQSAFAEREGAFMFQLMSKFRSHGETVLMLVEGLPNPQVALLDEPDASLSPRSAHRLAAVLRERQEKQQLLVAVHNPIVIAAFEDVLSLEHRRWMPAQEFLESQSHARENP
jgi:predicted ATPase